MHAGLHISRGLGLHCFAVAATAAKPTAAVVKKAHGFTLQREQFIKEYDSNVLIYKHDKTGEPPVCTERSLSVIQLPCQTLG